MNTEMNLEVQLWNDHGFFDTLCSRVLQKRDGFMCDLTEFDAIVSKCEIIIMTHDRFRARQRYVLGLRNMPKCLRCKK